MDPLRGWKGFSCPQFSHLAPSFADSFHAVIARYAKKKFVVCVDSAGGRREGTFGEFSADVAKVRALLEPERRHAKVLALIDHNSYENMVFACAAWLEGFTLCPLNPEEGRERIAKKLAQLGEPATVWALPKVMAEFAGLVAVQPLRIPSSGDAGAAKPFLPEQPMVLIFTSGSTGASKVVEQMESGILSNVDALISRHGLQEPACVATPLPLFHVNALEFAFLSTLLSGSTFVLFEKFKLGQLLSVVQDEAVNILSIIPPMVRVLCQRKREVLAANLSNLRYVVTAAAPLSPALCREFLETFPFRLLQGYGLSEAVNFSALMPRDLSPEDYARWMSSFERPSIGTAIEGNELFVLDDNCRELGPRELGEIAVRGFNVMRGYRHDERAECFRGGYLHTGDLGHFEEGAGGERFFFVSGRLKETIKRYGETVSLVEMDEILGQWGEAEAIAVPFEHELAGEELGVVLSVPSESGALLLSLKEYLEKLPAVVRPSVILCTGQALRTPSGKPTRWIFKPAFTDFRSRILGTTILTGNF